ncbi:hypothetical protein FD724_06880 [Nostoc sp. C057]|uniref:tyrosine-type recombinase/integrase n=1 Tax=Nostoc sp. C057 TaxID=2576903 RepID=UPI0015C3E7BB|nr:hypothetical protein FD724_06880 [Nostoc sp. C057]
MELEQLRATEYVFTNSKSLPIDRMAAHRIIKEAATLAGINPEVSAHWVEAYACDSYAIKGAPLALVRDTLGHSSVSTTNQYLHANPTDSSSNYAWFMNYLRTSEAAISDIKPGARLYVSRGEHCYVARIPGLTRILRFTTRWH